MRVPRRPSREPGKLCHRPMTGSLQSLHDVASPRAIALTSSRHAARIVTRQTTMLELADGQRAVLVQAFPAFLRQQPFSTVLALAGIGIWLWCVGLAVVLSGERR
jgi:hypothetical protein